MGFVIGIISTTLLLCAIYFKIDANRKTLAKTLFIIGITGMIFFALIMARAIYV